MDLKKLFFIVSFVVAIISCSTKKDIIYLQNSDQFVNSPYTYIDYKIQPGDILNIVVSTSIPEAAIAYNRMSQSSAISNSLEVLKVQGYQVNNLGNINFPGLNKVNVMGKTLPEIEILIFDLLFSKGLLKGHSVSVKLLNSTVTVLGEVNRPGTFNFLESNININEVLGLAGDLTITAKRNDIKLIRDINGERKIFKIDLTNIDYLNSESYQIYNGDIIIVNPNTTRVKNSGIIGNSGTLISLLSFILTSIIVIRN